ncbi:MAG: hypothetical protein NTW19_04755 [Planctomycetota bacterium]|nr:hypothetical protein [Planctomycetota bacterium]
MRRFGLPNMMYIPVTQWLPLFKFEQSNDGFPYPYGQTVRAEVADILVMAVFALLPAAWVIIRLRPRKPPAGHCQACGYDLRGTPADNACPECGAIPSPATISP